MPDGPAAETGRVTTPSSTYVLDTPPPVLTDWHVEGEACCPDCGVYIDLDCSLDDLVKATALHQCERQAEAWEAAGHG